MRVAHAILFAALFTFAFVLEGATLVALVAPARLDDGLARSPSVSSGALACAAPVGRKC
jgi:hypothetical protein